jgi:hypothetical protein
MQEMPFVRQQKQKKKKALRPFFVWPAAKWRTCRQKGNRRQSQPRFKLTFRNFLKNMRLPIGLRK